MVRHRFSSCARSVWLVLVRGPFARHARGLSSRLVHSVVADLAASWIVRFWADDCGAAESRC